jgi:hypothetical protein
MFARRMNVVYQHGVHQRTASVRAVPHWQQQRRLQRCRTTLPNRERKMRNILGNANTPSHTP